MDQNSPVFENEDSRLFHEKVLRHDIQQAEEELEDIRWKQRDLLTRHKKHILGEIWQIWKNMQYR